MSHGKYCIKGNVTDRWYVLPRSVSEYRISPRNLEIESSRVRDLVEDTLAAADKDVVFSQYDFVTIFMDVKSRDYGMPGLCAYPGVLGWDRSLDRLTTPGGQKIRRGIAVFTYQAHLGTLFHDIAHVLGGVKNGKRVLPCLYDHDLQSRPSEGNPRALWKTFDESKIHMGSWDPMSCHFYKRRLPPPGISSWTKIRLGWLDHSKIKVVDAGETANVTLGPLADASSETLAIKLPLTDRTYYLIENRQPLGFDRNLPGNGILIMYADDSISECRHGRGPVKLVNADPAIPKLQGAAFDIGKNEEFVDERNGVRIHLKKRIGSMYQVLVERKRCQNLNSE
jgi:M6 family metalloprotease-like protein